ncbi:MAG: 2-oxoacid:acceptor oxidoreductase family protein [Saccharofermentanales bacterium]|jgi:2-oxoglutarate ferredoxin oxidoreductase subunit gamma
MAYKEIIISGFGGQGVMAIGKTLTEAGMVEDMNVSWLPSYGPEMRGGTANCSVVIADSEIISPIVLEPTELIAMNEPSLDKFEPHVKKGGTIFVNSSIVSRKIRREDVDAVYVPTAEIATELGNMRVANMVMLGAFIRKTQLLKFDTIVEMLKRMFTGRKAHLVGLNEEALKRGAACACLDD